MKVAAFWIFTFCYIYSQTPGYRIEYYSIEEGLSQCQVNSIILDKSGFLWMGCQDGLNRFDGYSFEIFKNDPENNFSLSNNNIMCMYADESGNIWIGTQGGGLNKFYNNKYFKNINNSLEYASDIEHEIITSIASDNDGNLWAGTQRSGLIYIDRKNNKIKRIYHPDILNLIVTSIVVDREGALWLGTEKGLCTYDHKKQSVNKINKIPYGENVKSILKDKNDNIWIGTASGGLVKYDAKNNLYSNIRSLNGKNICGKSINCIFQSTDGSMWIGTENGLDQLNNSEIVLHLDLNSSPALNDNYVRFIQEDNSGVIWIGTNYGGVNKLIKQKSFRSYNNIAYKGKPYSIWAIHHDKNNNLWVGTDGDGLFRLDNKTSKVFQFKNNIRVKNSISGNSVSAIIKSKNGGLWVATYGNGLNYLDTTYKKFKYINLQSPNDPLSYNLDRNNNTSLTNDYICALIEDRNGVLWVGTADGLKKYNPVTGKIYSYKNIPGNKQSLSHNRILSLLDDGNYIWIGTYGGGLNKFHKKSGKCTIYKNKPGDKTSISNNSISCIYKDDNNIIWLATDVGFNRFDPGKNIFTRFTEKDGLPNYVIYAVVGDASGNFWLSTNNGISRFDPIKNKFKNYTVKDGLESNEFNQGAYFKGLNGEIFFGGIKGVNSFFPESLSDNGHLPPVIISKVKIGNDIISSDRLIDNELTISHYENFLNFEFVGLDFVDPSRNDYKYIMEGFDKEWINAGNKRFASYPNLDPGEYEFKVIAANNDGIWNSKGAGLKVVVLPPYWQTWWFRLTSLFIVTAILTLIYRSRIKRVREIERLRIRIASDLHDELGSSLTKISMNAGMAEYDDSIEKVKQKLRKIEDSSREVISSMSDIVWSIDARNDTLGTIIDRMKNFSFNLFVDSETEVLFDIENLDFDRKIPIDIRQNLYLIFKEALNNAAKYSHATIINVALMNCDGRFIMKIFDNGIGFPENISGAGNGLKNMQLRAKRINAKLDITNSDGVSIALVRKEL